MSISSLLKAPIKTGSALDLRGLVVKTKMAKQYNFISPVYNEMKKGDQVFVRFVDDYNTGISMSGTCIARNRKDYSSSFTVTDKEMQLTRTFPFFSPLLLNVEIRKRNEVKSILQAEDRKKQQNKRKNLRKKEEKLEKLERIAKSQSKQ
eukprot:TRINITY_DN15530_c0_g1_i1.p1 TRINITY_DN15530_c0_g1~~TRINITY_DN15530_c0_g1_i1.p1  ORF type:complete len:149 (-),score=51.59 TRINITY_DN15530_c0_g1_i1:110-556(-)